MWACYLLQYIVTYYNFISSWNLSLNAISLHFIGDISKQNRSDSVVQST
jgi:hypothetical protein